MARPTRQGVDYFPLDVHLDDKFKFIEIKFGLKGFAVIIKLLQKIYSCGYWYKWEEDEKLIFAHENGIEKGLLQEIINESIERDVFNKNLYEKYQILTSNGIQTRYKEIVKRRKGVDITEEYLLVDNNFGVNADTMHTSSKHNDNNKLTPSKQNEYKSTQSKVNKHNTFFEEVWSLYPNKKGKGTVSVAKKKEIYDLGEEFKRCISRYEEYVKAERKKGFADLKYQNGSTFFNSGYVDYLDENVIDKKKELKARPPLKMVYRDSI